MVGVVGINVAGELAGRDGESGALDGLHEEGSRGLAGEGGDARASGAADEGGDRHCEGVRWSGDASEVEVGGRGLCF